MPSAPNRVSLHFKGVRRTHRCRPSERRDPSSPPGKTSPRRSSQWRWRRWSRLKQLRQLKREPRPKRRSTTAPASALQWPTKEWTWLCPTEDYRPNQRWSLCPTWSRPRSASEDKIDTAGSRRQRRHSITVGQQERGAGVVTTVKVTATTDSLEEATTAVAQ